MASPSTPGVVQSAGVAAAVAVVVADDDNAVVADNTADPVVAAVAADGCTVGAVDFAVAASRVSTINVHFTFDSEWSCLQLFHGAMRLH